MSLRWGFLVVVVTGLVCAGLGVLAGWLIWGNHGDDTIDDDHVSLLPMSMKSPLMDGIRAQNIDSNLRIISSRTRVAGMSGSQQTAQFLKNAWIDQGLDTAGIDTYEALLSYPAYPDRPNKVEILDTDGHPIFSSADVDTVGWEDGDVPPYCAYSSSGHVEGELVYANFATEADFEMLWKNFTINVRGKIILARQGRSPSHQKVKLAADRGAAGLILFLDPFSVAKNTSTYPDGGGLPSRASFWNTLMTASGDPLTPGYPATRYSSRPSKVSWSSVESPIPVHGVSYRTAQELFNSISASSPRIPETYSWRDWQRTGLPESTFNYTMHLGPEMYDGRTVKLSVRNKLHMRPVRNAFGMIRGAVEPDRLVMIGNHRDAWGKGAVDAASSTAVMLEISRVMGRMLKKGWRPRRSILFCSWDAEEFGLIGSTEFVEDKLHFLKQNGVVYINMDTSVTGTQLLAVTASPSLNSLVHETLQKIPHPRAVNAYEDWKQNSFRQTPIIDELHPNSDHTAFYFTAGIPCLSLYYTEKKYHIYSAYHTGVDTYDYLRRFIDPDLEYHVVIGKAVTEMLRSLADSQELPLSVRDYAWKVRSRLTMFHDQILGKYKWFKTKKGQRMTDHLENSWTNFVHAANDFHLQQESQNETSSELQMRITNDKRMQLERAFIDPQWRQQNTQFHHVLFSPGRHCCAGINDALVNPAVEPFLNEDVLPNQAYLILQKQFAVLTHAFYAATNVMLTS